MEERRWAIRRSRPEYAPWYAGRSNGIRHWTSDPHDALRFKTRAEALRVSREMLPRHHVEEMD